MKLSTQFTHGISAVPQENLDILDVYGSQFVAPVVFSSFGIQPTISTGVLQVFFTGAPLKVLCSIISLNAILMVDFFESFWIGYKGLRNKTMDFVSFPTIGRFGAKANGLVPVSRLSVMESKPIFLPVAPNATLTRNGKLSFPPRYVLNHEYILSAIPSIATL